LLGFRSHGFIRCWRRS